MSYQERVTLMFELVLKMISEITMVKVYKHSLSRHKKLL